MKDIAPEIQEKIVNEYAEKIKRSEILKDFKALIKDKKATYGDANKAAQEVGDILAGAFKNNLSADQLPDQKMYYNIAQRVVGVPMQNAYETAADIAESTQKVLNENAGIGIKAIRPQLEQGKIDGIINRISNTENFDEIGWILDAPIKLFCRSVIDESVKINAGFQDEAGLKPRIIRKASKGACKRCRKLAGRYNYADAPNDVYRRHNNCKCTVEYDPGDGRRQDVWSKEWKNSKKSSIIKKRKEITPTQRGLKQKALEKKLEEENGLAYRISEHPKMLQAYTPSGLKKALENAGYEVKPLGIGNFKGVPFEDGGGYRVSYGGDRYLQYHPKEGSHHSIEYYKTSSGKNGTRRYNTKGDEINKDGSIKED